MDGVDPDAAGAAALAVLTVAPTAIAAPTDLDPTFGTGGAFTFSVVPQEDRIEDVAIAPDGKIVAVGASYDAVTKWDMAVARFNPDGSPDTTFSGDGRLTFDVTGGHNNDGASAVVVQPDGKIVVAGHGQSASMMFAIVRFMPDGSFDSSFGSNPYGRVMPVFMPSSSNQRATAIALQPDGKLVVGGHSNSSGTADFAILRLLANGALDPDFGTGGKFSHPVGAGTDEINDIVIQPDGRIVVAGEADDMLTGTDVAIVRYNANGTLDTTYNFVGVQKTALSTDSDSAKGVVLQPDGKIVIGGEVESGDVDNIALARFGAGGALDPSFGTGGVVITGQAPYQLKALDIATQNNGKFVIAGYNYLDTPSVQDFLVAQYTSSGALDTSFDGDGVMTRSFASPESELAEAVAVQPDGKIVVGGFAWVGTNYDFALMRLAGELSFVSPLPLPTPSVTIKSPSSKRVRAKKLKRLSGVAGPAGDVAKVDVALRRVDRKLQRRGRCLWLRNARVKFARSRTAKQRCSKPRFLAARGAERWAYRLRKRLPRGSYELYVRVTLKSGGQHKAFSTGEGNLFRFKVD